MLSSFPNSRGASPLLGRARFPPALTRCRENEYGRQLISFASRPRPGQVPHPKTVVIKPFLRSLTPTPPCVDGVRKTLVLPRPARTGVSPRQRRGGGVHVQRGRTGPGERKNQAHLGPRREARLAVREVVVEAPDESGVESLGVNLRSHDQSASRHRVGLRGQGGARRLVGGGTKRRGPRTAHGISHSLLLSKGGVLTSVPPSTRLPTTIRALPTRKCQR